MSRGSSEPPKSNLINILKVMPSCKLYNKYMIVLTHTTNTEIFAFIAVQVFKLLSRIVLFMSRKTIEAVK